MSHSDKIIARWLIAYLVGAMFINSYIRQCRYNDWKKDMGTLDSNMATIAATTGWPFYVGICITDKITSVVLNTKISIEKPEIIQ